MNSLGQNSFELKHPIFPNCMALLSDLEGLKEVGNTIMSGLKKDILELVTELSTEDY